MHSLYEKLRRRIQGIMPYWQILVGVGLVWLKLRLVAAQPIAAIGWAKHDDYLFLKLAESLLKGSWLGTFDELTLAKGCGYPIWIALTSWLGIPLLLSQHLLYLAAVLTLLVAIRPMYSNRTFLLLVGAVLWLNPASYTVHVLRVMREGIYPALTLFAVAGVAGAVARLRQGAWRPLWPWLVVAGVALAAFWQTREEGIWILPLFAVATAFTAVSLWWRQIPRRWTLALACLAPLVAVPCGDWALARKNLAAYGIPVTVEFRTHDFLAAYGALTRVKPMVPHTFVSTAAREQIYAVSPAFAKLRRHLEGRMGKAWSQGGWAMWPDLAHTEIGGGIFMWAFRDAVAREGYYQSGTKAMQYYRQLATEVNLACDQGKLDCLPPRATMMPAWRSEYGAQLLAAVAKGIPYAMAFEGVGANPAASIGKPETQAKYHTLTHDRIAPLNVLSDVRVQGWLVGRQGITAVAVKHSDGSLNAAGLKWLDSPDVRQAFQSKHLDYPHMDKARFEVVLPADAELEVTAGATTTHIPVSGKARSGNGPELYFALDAITTVEAPAIEIAILNAFTKMYQLTVPLLTLLAFLALLAQTVQGPRQRKLSETWAVQAGLLAIVLTRVTMLSMVEVTSFSAINPLYLSAAYPPLLLFVCLALRAGADILVERIRRQPNPVS